MRKFLFISIKPEFANKILLKKKRIELRKNKPNARIGDYVLIYSTQPRKSVIGFAKIKNIIDCAPNEMWENNAEYLGIDKKRFFDYYNGHKKAIGIELTDVCRLKVSIPLQEIKNVYPKFSPPQTYKYIPYFTALKFYKGHLDYASE
ncbi:MAG: ASCH domain-containing protein [Draconibacterium sp.]